MTTQTEALKLALSVLKGCLEHPDAQDAINGIEAALAQPEPEPVAIALNTGTRQAVKWLKNVEHGKSLYTAPPKRNPLTDDALDAKRYRYIIANGMPHQGGNCCWYLDLKRFSTAEEAIDYALGIKE